MKLIFSSSVVLVTRRCLTGQCSYGAFSSLQKVFWTVIVPKISVLFQESSGFPACSPFKETSDVWDLLCFFPDLSPLLVTVFTGQYFCEGSVV